MILDEDDLQKIPTRCGNCTQPMTDHYCSHCGQRSDTNAKSIWALSRELSDELLSLDFRIVKTLQTLLLRPGYLTVEFFKGRRARYTPPLRLYLVISFLFFFLMPDINRIDETDLNRDNDIDIQSDFKEFDFDGVRITWLNDDQQHRLDQTLEIQLKKFITLVRDNPAELYSQLLDKLSAVMFFMLPVFAIFLRLIYLGQPVLYVEHLLLAVHNHCFLFLALLLSGSLDLIALFRTEFAGISVTDLIDIWIPLYMYFSLRRVFGQSHLVTLFKFSFLLLCYLTLSIFGGVIALTVGLFTI